MTSVFDQQGKRVPVTVIEAGPCKVTSIRSKEKEGYSAIQLGYEDIREKLVNKPKKGFFAKNKIEAKRFLREFRTEKAEGIEVGTELRVDNFHLGDFVDVSGISIGKGFQGVVKRHGYSGGPASHGAKTGRRPGSIGMCATPARVLKGTKLPGQMGNKRVTVQNMKVVGVDLEHNLMTVKGSIPGAEGSFLIIQNSIKKGLKDKAWKPFTKESLDVWKKEIEDLKAAEKKKIDDAEAAKKAKAAAAAKKAATQAPGRGKTK